MVPVLSSPAMERSSVDLRFRVSIGSMKMEFEIIRFLVSEEEVFRLFTPSPL